MFDASSIFPSVIQFRQQHKQTLCTIEEKYDTFKKYLPMIGRFLTVLTFMEDSFRILTGFGEQVDFVSNHLHIPLVYPLACVFVLFSLVAQTIGSVLILVNKKVNFAACILGAFLFLSFFVFGLNAPEWVHVNGRDSFIIRIVAQSGALIMLAAQESMVKKRGSQRAFAGNLTIVDPLAAAHKLQLLGRCMVVALCLSVFRHGLVSGIITSMVGVMVMAGFKARIATMVVCFIFVFSMFATHDFQHGSMEAVLFVLCQDLSIFGGLITLLLNANDQGISVDRKNF